MINLYCCVCIYSGKTNFAHTIVNGYALCAEHMDKPPMDGNDLVRIVREELA